MISQDNKAAENRSNFSEKIWESSSGNVFEEIWESDTGDNNEKIAADKISDFSKEIQKRDEKAT